MRFAMTLVMAARRRSSREGGFTIVELMIAVTIMVAALLVLIYAITTGFSSIGYSRQRITANQLAAQTMEQLRALPFSYISNGLSSSDGLSTDTNISVCPGGAGPYCLVLGGVTELIPNGTLSYASVQPLIPHVQTVSPAAGQAGSGTTYTIRTYVTNYCPNGGSDGQYCSNFVTQLGAYRVTVMVSWANPDVKGVSSSVRDQSIVYNPAGCVSSTTHPFQSPCQPFFYGNAGVAQGTVQLTGTVAGTSFTSGVLRMASWDANVQREQLDQETGHFWGGGATLSQSGQPDQNVNQSACQSQAGNDPATSNPVWQQAPSASDPCSGPVPEPGPASVSVAGTASLTLTARGGDNGQTISTVSSSTSPSQPCVNYAYNATSQTDNLPCSSAQGLQVGSLSATLGLNGLGSARVVRVGAPTCVSITSTPNCGSAFDNFDIAPDAVNSAWCPTTTINNGGLGCLHAEAGRTIGPSTFGALPNGLSGGELAQVPGWINNTTTAPYGGWFNVQGYQDSVTSEIGTGTASPPASNSVTGTLTYYDQPTGTYKTSLVTAAQNTVPVQPVCIYDASFSGGPLLIAIGANPVPAGATGCTGANSPGPVTLTTGGASASASSCAPGPATCQATSSGPLTGSFYYTVIQNSQIVAQTQVQVNFGQLIAKATYSAG